MGEGETHREERAGGSRQAAHEVDDDREDEDLGHVVRGVGERHGDGRSGRAVEGELLVPVSDGAAEHLRRELVEGLEPVAREK